MPLVTRSDVPVQRLPSGVERTLAFDDGQDVGRALRTFRGSYLGGVTSNPTDVLILGASFEEGYGTTLMTNGWTAVFRDVLRAFAQPKGIAGGGATPAISAAHQSGVGNYFGFNPYQTVLGGVYADSPITAAAGTFSQPPALVGLGLRCLRCANGSTFTLTFYGTGADLAYTTRTGGGTFQYSVDGGGATAQSTAAAASNGNRVTIRGLTSGVHTIAVTITAAGTDTFGVDFEGAVFYDGDESSGIRVWQAARAGYDIKDFVAGTGTTTWVNSIQSWNVPDLVIWNLGFNGWNTGRTTAQIKADLLSAITLVKNRISALGAPAASQVVMSSFTVTPAGSTNVEPWANVVRAYREIAAADDDVCVFDYQHWFGKDTETSVSTRGGILVADGLHPTDGGAAIIGGAMANFVLDSSERMRDLARFGTGKKVSALPAATANSLAGTETLPVVQAGASKKATVSDVRRHVPFEFLIFHMGATAVYTLTPLTAGTVEPANAPMARILADLATATQMRLVIGQRIIGAGGTSCEARLQYATNGATQTAWADANNTGSGLSLLTGTANTIRATSWVDLAAGAKIADCYMRLAIVTVGTVTTAPTISWAAAEFR